MNVNRHLVRLQVAVLIGALPFVALSQQRALSSAEANALINVAIAEGFRDSPEIVEAYVGALDDGSPYAEATLMSEPYRVGSDSCMAATLSFAAQSSVDGELRWEPFIDTLGYEYWRHRSDCADRNHEDAISIRDEIPTDTLERIVDMSSRLLGRASEYLSRARDEPVELRGSISQIAIDFDESSNRYLYRVWFGVSQCYVVDVSFRIRDDFEVVDVGEVLC